MATRKELLASLGQLGQGLSVMQDRMRASKSFEQEQADKEAERKYLEQYRPKTLQVQDQNIERGKIGLDSDKIKLEGEQKLKAARDAMDQQISGEWGFVGPEDAGSVNGWRAELAILNKGGDPNKAISPQDFYRAKKSAMQDETRTQEAHASDLKTADVQRRVALRDKPQSEKAWRRGVDAEGNYFQENTITGETRPLGIKAPDTKGTQKFAKEELEGLKTEAISQVDELLNHPGFSGAVGVKGLAQLGGLRGEPISGTDEADFVARLEQIQGGAFLQARQLLKGAGAITDFESKKAEAAMTRMRTSVSEKDFRVAAKDYKDALLAGMRKLEGETPGASGSWGESKAGAKPKFKIIGVE